MFCSPRRQRSELGQRIAPLNADPSLWRHRVAEQPRCLSKKRGSPGRLPAYGSYHVGRGSGRSGIAETSFIASGAFCEAGPRELAKLRLQICGREAAQAVWWMSDTSAILKFWPRTSARTSPGTAPSWELTRIAPSRISKPTWEGPCRLMRPCRCSTHVLASPT